MLWTRKRLESLLAGNIHGSRPVTFYSALWAMGLEVMGRLNLSSEMRVLGMVVVGDN